MLMRTSQYALRALIYLAQNEDAWPIPGAQIAAETGVPTKYLSKVLGDLVRCGVLDSAPGRTGGFRLRRPAAKIRLFDVLAPFEHFERRECPFGNRVCSDTNPCGAHDSWKKVVGAQQDFLRETSLREVAKEARQVRRSASGARTNSRRR